MSDSEEELLNRTCQMLHCAGLELYFSGARGHGKAERLTIWVDGDTCTRPA